MHQIFFLTGVFLSLFGGIVSVVFWIPRVVDRRQLKDILGNRYPFIYIIYSANGPLLFVAGIALVLFSR